MTHLYRFNRENPHHASMRCRNMNKSWRSCFYDSPCTWTAVSLYFRYRAVND